MGHRGRKPLPANVHLLRGNPSKLSAAALLDENIRPKVEIPSCPAHLNDEARKEWKRVTRYLAELGLVSQIDRGELAAYCEAWGDFVWAGKRIREQGKDDPTGDAGRIGETPSGLRRPSVHMQIKYRALEAMDRFAAKFGMSPSDRSRVTPSDAQLALPGMEAPQEGGWGNYN